MHSRHSCSALTWPECWLVTKYMESRAFPSNTGNVLKSLHAPSSLTLVSHPLVMLKAWSKKAFQVGKYTLSAQWRSWILGFGKHFPGRDQWLQTPQCQGGTRNNFPAFDFLYWRHGNLKLYQRVSLCFFISFFFFFSENSLWHARQGGTKYNFPAVDFFYWLRCEACPGNSQLNRHISLCLSFCVFLPCSQQALLRHGHNRLQNNSYYLYVILWGY